MSTPKSISGTNHPRQPNSPFHTISFSNRDSSPRAASLARLAQSPIGTPLRSGAHTPTQRRGSGTVTPTSMHPAAPLLAQDFPKIESYGSINAKPGTSALSRQEWQPQDEDPEIIKKHLVSGFESGGTSTPQVHTSPKPGAADGVPLSEEFNSLQLQGGDITRQVYRYAEQSARRGSTAHQRSHSFSHPVRHEEGETAHDIMVPGGFRRNFIQRAYTQPTAGDGPPTFVTRNFLHFLTLYGHFAGEDLEDWEDAITEEEDREVREDEDAETRPLLKHKGRAKSYKSGQGNATMTKAALLLLKSFVGTGVLFLPKAFKNGGMLFSSLLLPVFAMFSLYCFMLLVNTRKLVVGSYGDIGGALYGKKMRWIILASIVISQIGFVCAYTIFTAENLSAFVSAVTRGEYSMDVRYLILLQLVILLPCAMIRDISKLSGTALVADFFIMLGLCVLYYFDIFTLATKGVADITLFNSHDYVLFLGTAAFAFEGIGLVIPIQESMARPEKFKFVLTGVMIILILVFTSIGALSYAAYGSAVKTVIISSLPQDSAFVNAVQFLYSLAILLSTPLQLFPAIRILENGTGLALRSGKRNPYIKWKKNIFRFAFVIMTAGISAAGANSLERFVSLTGSLTCVPLMFIYPPLLHYRACAESWQQKVIDVCICIFGMVATVYNTMETTKGWLY